jgi:hypothetical protein
MIQSYLCLFMISLELFFYVNTREGTARRFEVNAITESFLVSGFVTSWLS